MYRVLDVTGYEELISKHHISSLLAKVLINRRIPFTNKIIEKDSYEYKNMDKVVGMILKTINDNKKIVIYGDYDADGVCSVSILKRTFDLLNYEIGYYLPNRYDDGYGLNIRRVKQFYEKGYSLIICVDNGIKAFDAIDEAKKLGMSVIVLDHHQKDDSLPNYDLCLHPQYSSFSEYNMCGASICYYLSKALLAKEDEVCLALAGIATIGDVMPLVEQNKIIVNKALAYLNKNKYKAIDLLNIKSKKYTEDMISMQIVPRINSIGRVCKGNTINNLVKYLTTNNEKEMIEFAKFIEKTNEERKCMADFYFKKLDKENYTDKIIVEKDDEMLEGINGIIAGKLSEKYNMPCIIFSLDEEKKNYKGSARSVEGISIIELFDKNKYISVYGGHEGAGGLTVSKENYNDFVNKIKIDCKECEYKEKVLEVIEVSEEELTLKAYQDLQKIAPFGEGNEKPLFLLKNHNCVNLNKSKDGKHVLLKINDTVNLTGFNLVKELKKDCASYDLIFNLELNDLYSNKLTCNCKKMEVN